MDPQSQRFLARSTSLSDLPVEESRTLASNAAGPPVTAYPEHLKMGCALKDMPLFLREDRSILVPLEATYQAAYRGVPGRWREVLEEPSS